MGNGMSDYWRARRAHDREQQVMKGLYHVVRALLDNKPSPNVLLIEVKRMTEEIERAVAEATAQLITQPSERPRP